MLVSVLVWLVQEIVTLITNTAWQPSNIVNVFGFPVLADFEMRGMLGDIKRVAAIIADLYELES